MRYKLEWHLERRHKWPHCSLEFFDADLFDLARCKVLTSHQNCCDSFNPFPIERTSYETLRADVKPFEICFQFPSRSDKVIHQVNGMSPVIRRVVSTDGHWSKPSLGSFACEQDESSVLRSQTHLTCTFYIRPTGEALESMDETRPVLVRNEADSAASDTNSKLESCDCMTGFVIRSSFQSLKFCSSHRSILSAAKDNSGNQYRGDR